MSELARPIQQLDVVATAPLEAYRYVTRAGAYPATAGYAIFGVTRNAAKLGERVAVDKRARELYAADDKLSYADAAHQAAVELAAAS